MNHPLIPVRLEPAADTAMERIFRILKARVESRCRVNVVPGNTHPHIVLAIDRTLPADAFRLEPAGQAVRVAGSSTRGLLYGVGKFLRTSRYEGAFSPSSWRGTSAPQGSLRGLYFASHFHNWYQMAGEDELIRYLEDLALWGVQTIMAVFPFIHLTGWDDPEAEPALLQIRRLFRAAKDLGLDTATIANNVLFTSTPPEVRATPVPDPLHRHGNSGTTVCPGTEAGRTRIIQTNVRLLEQLADVGLDYLCLWPYDEGGCGCDRCRPWGAHGFPHLSRAIAEAGRTILPDLKIILSTWTFDTPPEGEWQGLTDYLARDGNWVDYILADAHEDFPRYPLDTGVPGHRPLLNFPEISMWGNWPWGGYGAHPLPARMQRLWNQVRHIVQGGFPYSEGLYEDITKTIVTQFYWDRDRSAQETLREYIAYEFSPAVTEDVLTLIDILETTAGNGYTHQPVNTDAVRRARRLAESVDARLPDWARRNWRWEILRLRTILDDERWAGGGCSTPDAQAAMERIAAIYRCPIETDDPYHHRVRPPLKRAVSRCGEW